MSNDPRIKIVKKMALKEPIFVAAWPGMGLVGFNAVEFLRQTLGADRVAEIEPSDFFSIQGITVKDGVAVPLRVPSNVFHGWKNPNGGHDLLLFLGTAQPVNGREMALSNLVLDVAEKFGVSKLYTAAAMASQIDHLAASKVYAVSNDSEQSIDLGRRGADLLKEGDVGGLNGLLIGVAQQRGLTGACLMGEMPHYTTHIENPKASKAVLEMLLGILDLELDLSPLQERARFIETQIQGLLQQARERAEGAGGTAEAGSEPDEEQAEEAEEEPDEDPGSSGGSKGGGPAIN